MTVDTLLPITKRHARKILNLIDKHGLSAGMGRRRPDNMCIMALFNFVLGRPHTDNGLEDCVGSAVRSLDIWLNDLDWSSNAARGNGLRREAIAKIGSNTIDQNKFTKLFVLRTIQKIGAQLFRDLAKLTPDGSGNAIKLLEAADRCARADDIGSASRDLDLDLDLDRDLDRDFDFARALAFDLDLDLAFDLDLARACARARALAFDFDLALAFDVDLALARARARALDLARARARALALALARDLDFAFARARVRARDQAYTDLAEIAVEVLIELKSPGCAWLSLCDQSPVEVRRR